MKTYPIADNSRVYEDIYYLIVSIASMCVAIDYKINGSSQFTAKDFILIDGKSTNKQIAFPLFGPVEGALKNEKPDHIEISVFDINSNESQSENHVHKLFALKLFENLFSSYFISYYERNIVNARKKFDSQFGEGKHSQWPSSWRMGWVVRNALVHNGKVFYNPDRMEAPPVDWHNAHVSPQNQDSQLLGNILNFADLLILVFDMDVDLSN